ncbi:hypothetical protein J2W51_000333 [Tardiphaga robiniae]|uniref:hypothetical protein n=1 Tax=Tardiphaga robiniae TaxID=943830 RepID=UPI002858D7F5|nr:hypothetical protein [Tardiphaga robiniae]MDR6657791.1 hypothetical protein [Tardiphaga robiniae]
MNARRTNAEEDEMAERINDFLDPLSFEDLELVRYRAHLLLRRKQPGREEGRSQEPLHVAYDAAALRVRHLRDEWLKTNKKKGRGVPESITNDLVDDAIQESSYLRGQDDSERKIHSAILERIFDKKLKG